MCKAARTAALFFKMFFFIFSPVRVCRKRKNADYRWRFFISEAEPKESGHQNNSHEHKRAQKEQPEWNYDYDHICL